MSGKTVEQPTLSLEDVRMIGMLEGAIKTIRSGVVRSAAYILAFNDGTMELSIENPNVDLLAAASRLGYRINLEMDALAEYHPPGGAPDKA